MKLFLKKFADTVLQNGRSLKQIVNETNYDKRPR
jgi:hypothetical protein